MPATSNPKFTNPVDLPNRENFPTQDTPSGFLKLFAKDGLVRTKNEIGENSTLSPFPLFIQETQPTYADGPYYWVQLNLGGNPDDFTVWFHDGVF